MDSEEIWDQLCRKRPALRNGEAIVQFKSKELKRLLVQVWEQGKKHSPEVDRGDLFGDLFGQVFGSKG